MSSPTITQNHQDLYDRMPQYISDARLLAGNARRAFRLTRRACNGVRSAALLHLANLLETADARRMIMTANEQDIAAARASGLSEALTDRLRLDDARIQNMADALREIAAMPDPVGLVTRGERLNTGVELIQKRVPLGVVFTIYESRPNVTVDVGALCIKSGNTAILRGGKEALHSNGALFYLFQQALGQAGLPEDAVQLVQETDRAFMLACLKQNDLIDLVVPRGGEALIRFTAEHSSIPVVKHDKGVCNLYIHQDAPLARALEIAVNAKLQRPSVCNAIENLLIHERYGHTAELLAGLRKAGAILSGCARTHAIDNTVSLIPATEADAVYDTEFLDNRLSVKIVSDLPEALDFIDRYGSGHSEAIITNSIADANTFAEGVDTAAVFINCSTRFHDGGQMGLGAEVGISTDRLHVRGPMGIKDLTTTTYIMSGQGQVRS